MKEYLIAGNLYFDQLLFTGCGSKTRILLQRYTSGGTLLLNKDTPLLIVPRTMQANEFFACPIP
jgi:hypothetical protein